MAKKYHKAGKGRKSSNKEAIHHPELTQGGVLVSEEHKNVVTECRDRVEKIAADCRARNRKFRDIEFDLEKDRALCLRELAEKPSDPQRVTQLFKNPRFWVDGANPSDIVQGELGDCWFLSALATMSTTKNPEEKFCVARNEEIGVYGFVFFRDAKWVIVIIDDFLYTSIPKFEELSHDEQRLYHGIRENYNNTARKHEKNLYFAKSNRIKPDDPEETWVPLIEKAYAKLHGNYAVLDSGYAGEAIEDLTGGVTTLISTKDILSPDDFWCNELLNAHKDRLFACSFGSLKARVNGLIGGHAYSILRALQFEDKRFIVLRNPWGGTEWEGPWSDGSKEWDTKWLPALKALNHSFGKDGQFVMEYNDFLENWETIDRTLLFDSSWIMSSQWLKVTPRPLLEWSYGDVSFTISLEKASPVIIVLSKLDDRYFRQLASRAVWTFDFLVFKCGDKHPLAASSVSTVQNQRSVNAEFELLQAGEYIVHVRLDNQTPSYYQYFPGQLASEDDSVHGEDDISASTHGKNDATYNHVPNSTANRILFRDYAEKMRSQLIASNILDFEKTTAKKYLCTSLDTLVGKNPFEPDNDDEERTISSFPLEGRSGQDGEPVNSTSASGDNPDIGDSRAENEAEDISYYSSDDEFVALPDFLHPEMETTVVLGLRVYYHKTSHVKIKGHWRHKVQRAKLSANHQHNETPE